MATCAICGESLPEGARTCAVCGTSVPEERVPTATVVEAPSERTELVVPAAVPARGRFCPACLQVYGPDYDDAFCTCGVELMRPPTAVPAPAPAAVERPPAVRPGAGTPCLTLLGADRQPVQYFALTKDATLVGRLDPVAGVFPDVDLDAWLDPSLTRKISRQHALILRSRSRGTFSLRPLAGNTGTQLDAEMVLPLHDYPLPPGSRLILGGAVRLRFEIA